MTLMTNIKKYQNKLKGTPHAWIGRFNIIKLLFISKSTMRLNTILMKTSLFLLFFKTLILNTFERDSGQKMLEEIE